MGRGSSKAGGGSGVSGGGGSDIKFSEGIKQKPLIQKLANEYNTHLVQVSRGAHQAAGDTDITGMNMRISQQTPDAALHEFAHTLANTNADKYGLRNDQAFWGEIRKIRTAYRKDLRNDRSKSISAYADSAQALDEFMAEAFTQYKAKQMGIEIGSKYGSDTTYSKKVVAVVDKYFKRSK